MAQPVYDFVEQLERGQHWEGVLDEYFGRWYNIREATRDEQRKGIDRWFHPGDADGPMWAVEYKADDKTSKTGNVFVETMSIVERNKPGWAWKSEADMLVYLAIPDTLYIVPMGDVRKRIPEWRLEHGTRRVKNKAWTTVGIPVPEEDFAKICKVRRLT